MPPKSKRNRNYFTQETEDAILLYNKTESSNQRSKIYSKNIHYPFFKLTQNIIHTFKFYNTDVEDLEHLQHEIIVFLLEKMHLYHHSKSIDDRLFKIINKKFGNGLPTSGNSPFNVTSKSPNFTFAIFFPINVYYISTKLELNL